MNTQTVVTTEMAGTEQRPVRFPELKNAICHHSRGGHRCRHLSDGEPALHSWSGSEAAGGACGQTRVGTQPSAVLRGRTLCPDKLKGNYCEMKHERDYRAATGSAGWAALDLPSAASTSCRASSTMSRPWRRSSSLITSGGQTHSMLNRLNA